MIILIILSILGIALTAVLLIDAVPCVLRWYERIGIGSLSRESATKSIRAVATKWLIRTPSVPLKDETRLTVIDRIKGEYKSATLQSWQKAALLLGVYESGDRQTANRFVDSLLNENKTFRSFVKSPDFALLAYAVLYVSEDKASLKPAMDEVYVFLKELAKDSTVPYNAGIPDIRFVDTLGMVCPFLYMYAKAYNCDEAAAFAMRQLDEYKENAFNEKVNLPYHCINIKTGAPLGICGWGRGCGWYALALSEMLRVSRDEKILSSAEEFMNSLMPFMLQSGGFSRQLLFDKTGESSATAMIGHLSSVLYTVTEKVAYKECAYQCSEFIRMSTRKNGKVDYAQGDTKGIGFYSKKADIMPAAQGFSLLLMAETV